MDATSFSVYLKGVLSKNISDYTEVLCSGLSGDMNSIQRNTGRREVLVSLLNDLDLILQKFEEGNK